MAERVEIKDVDSASAWLETQEHQTQVWFATRCALRALPGLGTRGDATSSGLAFVTCRAMLISAAAATCPAAEMKGLKNSAARAATYSANSANTAAYSAAADPAAKSAVGSAAAAAYAAFSAATADANAPKSWGKLWPDIPQPKAIAVEKAWEALKGQW